MRSILYSLSDLSLHSILETELVYQEIVKKNGVYIIQLRSLIKKNCNGLTIVVTDNIIGNLIEGLLNFITICSEDYLLLLKYLQALKH